MPDRTYTPAFKSLDLKGTPWTRLAGSLAVNGAFIVALLLIPAAVTYTVQPVQKVTSISLIAPPPLTPYKPAYKPKPLPQITHKVVIPKPVKRFAAPVPKLAPVQSVKLIAPVAVEAPKVETAKLETPKIELPRPTAFPPNNEPAPAPAPVHVVKTGGFGDPNGVPANSASNRPSALVQAGAFDLSPGTGQGSGKGVAGKVLVASAGFGEGYGSGVGTGTGGSGNGHAGVRAGGFGDLDSAPRPERNAGASKPAAPAETPVEITFKPKPVYTPEAREKKIEGDVQLQVVFSSAGQIQVLRMLRGLGYGLDENARQAAAQIRFRPGTRNGIPVDVTGTVHIVFQIS